MSIKLIILCSRCGGMLLSNAEQKTKSCQYCGTRIIVENAKKIASAKTAFEASEILKKIKTKNKFNKTSTL